MFDSTSLRSPLVRRVCMAAVAVSMFGLAGCYDDGHRHDYDRDRNGPVIQDNHPRDGYYDQQRDYDRSRDGGYDHPGPVHPEGYYDDHR